MTGTLFPVSAGDVAITGDDWYTPHWLFEAAGLVFDMDVCAPVMPESRTCPARRYLTVVEDGLDVPWEGLVWMNPPFSRTRMWVEKWITHPDGLALLPAAQGSKGYSSTATLVGSSDAIAVLAGGLEFYKVEGPTSLFYAVILAARGEVASAALARIAARWSTPAWKRNLKQFP